MKKEEIIEQLFRMAEPEPWEPEITSKAREALYSAIDAIELTDAEEKYFKNDIKETKKACRRIRVANYSAGIRKKELLVDVIGAPAMLEQTAEECTELAQACLKYARYFRAENKVHRPFFDIKANFNEKLADVAICIDELANGDLIDAHAVEECKRFKYKRMKERMAKDSQ
jgi:NTP pyrophosphatase (non-canonical NTP hydrolase)